MKKEHHLQTLLTGAMFLCFGLALLMGIAVAGLHIHYRRFSDILEAPYSYYAEYYSTVVLRRHFILFLADCVLSVLAVVLLAVCGVCHRRKTMERTWQTSLASTLCGFTLPITLWIFLDWCISALGMMV